MLAVAALLAVVAASAVWLTALDPARAARRPFAGTWRLESPVFPARPELAVEVDLALDGTVRDRVWNPQTGAVEHEVARPGRWDVSADGRVQEFVRRDCPRSPREWVFGRYEREGWDHRASWDGPERLRLEDAAGSRPTMVWVRCDRP